MVVHKVEGKWGGAHCSTLQGMLPYGVLLWSHWITTVVAIGVLAM